MSLVSRRECHIVGVKNEELNKIVDEIKTFLKKRTNSRGICYKRLQGLCCLLWLSPYGSGY